MSVLPPLCDDPLVKEVTAFVESHGFARRYRELDRSPSFPWEEFRALGKVGLLGLRTASNLGGRGASLPRVAAALFHVAYRSGTAFGKLCLQPEFSSVLAAHGSRELVEEWFRPMMRGERLIGNQVTEPSAGSDALALKLSVERDRGDYLLTGEKSEVAFCQDAHAAIVYGKLAGGDPRSDVTAFLVPQDLPGVTRTLTSGDLGERWQRRGSIRYDHVRVPERFRIGDEGQAFGYLRDELTQERALLAAIYLGAAFASWEETVEYVRHREAFGKALARQEGVSFPLVRDEARLTSDWLFVENALARLDRGEPAGGEAAMAKWLAVEDGLRAIDHAIQFHGGRGYSQDLPHEQRWRDVRSGGIAHGPAEIMLVVAAHELRNRSST